MSETSGGGSTSSSSGGTMTAANSLQGGGFHWQDFAVRYKTAVSASLASLASTTVGYALFFILIDVL